MAGLTLLLLIISSCVIQINARSFVIDYKNNQFLKDGKPFRYISGSMHYFRMPKIYWQDRLERMLAAGLNAVQTYIDWGQHEPYSGTYNFSDNLDFVSFFQLANKMGLLVILRAGPFIAAERDMSGLPFWLMQEDPKIVLRSYDPTFIKCVDRWYGKVFPMIKPFLYSNGGPIISVQVENEYGSYFACDFNYMSHLRDLFRSYLGNDVILFTTDGGADSYLKCGKIANVYATVDFGPGTNVEDAFRAQRNHEPHGPLVNSEYYPGWLDLWGSPHANTDIGSITKTLDEMLAKNASVNMYMFHGGTNYGFTNCGGGGSNYQACTTSYDYNAPISEGGDIAEKYFAIRKVIQKYTKVEPGPVPKPIPKFAYGTVNMTPIATVFQLLPILSSSNAIQSKYPQTFESLGQRYGFMLYQTVVTGLYMDPVLLQVPGLHDRAIVFIDEIPVGILSRQDSIFNLPVTISNGQTLSLLVENQGRQCCSQQLDFKGITSNVTLGHNTLINWKMIPVPMNNTELLNKIAEELIDNKDALKSEMTTLVNGHYYAPGIYIGWFTAPNNSSFPQDTYLDPSGWHKGVAIINGFNLGRYWPVVGPQVTLYVPKSVLKPYPSRNILMLFELENPPCYSNTPNKQTCSVKFTDQPNINATTPS